MAEDRPLLDGIEDEDMLDAWAEFLCGSWECGDPDLPGWYPVATREGDVVDPREWVSVGETTRERGRGHAEPGWQGYRWSLPIPRPPKTPPRGES